MSQSIQAFTLGEIAVRQLNGLFSLNDLHRAAGAARRHEPARFIRLDGTKALIAELGAYPEMGTPSTDSQTPMRVINDGENNGTYACRELVIAYAAWISAAFHLKVIRVFLAVAAPQPAATPYSTAHSQTLSAEQASTLRLLLTESAKRLPQDKQAKAMIEGWSKLKAHFKTDYRHIPAAEFPEAMSIIARHITQWELVDDDHHQAAPAEALNNNDLCNMKRIVWLCANEFRTHDAAVQGIWHYLRQATHNPSPSPYTIEHIPTLAKELSRVYAIAASIGDLHRAIDAEAIRRIFRHGKEAEPVIRHMIDKAQQHASGQERTMQELLPTWAKDDFGDFAKRKPCLSLGLHEHQAEQPGFFQHHA